jgi:hypothetical protein
LFPSDNDWDILKGVPSARLTLHSTKLGTKLKISKKKIFFVTKITSETFLSVSQNLKVTRLQGCTQTKLVEETLIFQGHLNFFGARPWLRCAPVDGLTKTFVKQDV